MSSLVLTSNNILSSHVIQNPFTKQDVAMSGSTDYFDWILVSDGHGRGSNKHVLKNLFMAMDWNSILSDENFYKDIVDENGEYISVLYRNIQKASLDDHYNSKLMGVGCTLSVIKIFPKRFECYYIGDSSIKIYECSSENINIIMKSEDHNFSHSDTEVLKTRKCASEHPFRQTINWMETQGGIQTKNIWCPRVLDAESITMQPSFYVPFDDGSKINMSRALGHIPSSDIIEKFKNAGLELSLSQQSLTKNVVPRNPNKKYALLVATDGLWDMVCDKDDKVLGSFIRDGMENAAKNIAQFAKSRWIQEWNYIFPGTKISQKIVQKERDTDDVGIACAYC
jgi:serine/threonine protein phosphatase PrpC